MKKPKSKLPFAYIDSTTFGRYIYDSSGNDVVSESNKFLEQDLEYIVQCCNNFPKAIKLLAKLIYDFSEKGYTKELEATDKFLNKLENEKTT